MDWVGIAYLHLGQSVGEEEPGPSPDCRRSNTSVTVDTCSENHQDLQQHRHFHLEIERRKYDPSVLCQQRPVDHLIASFGRGRDTRGAKRK